MVAALTGTPLTTNTTGGGTLTSGSFTPATGETIAVAVVTEDSALVYNTPTMTGSTATFARPTGALYNTANHCWVSIWVGTVTAGGVASTIVSTKQGGAATRAALVAWRFTGAQLAVTPAIVSTAGSGATGASASLTSAAANSILVWALGDWAAIDGSARAYRSSATEDLYDFGTGVYTGFAAHQAAATAGAQTLGLTAPTGQTWALVGLEIQSASGTTNVVKTFGTSWAVRARVTKTLSTAWAVRTIVQKSISTAWAVRTSVLKTLASSWAVRARVAKTAPTTWNTRATVTKTASTSWSIRTSVAKTIATSWAVRQRVTKTIATAWDLSSSTTTVVKTLATSWAVRARVTKTTPTSWAVRTRVTKTLATSWAVRAQVLKTTATSWAVRTRAVKTIATVWAIRSSVSKSAATSWAVRQRVVKTSATTWNVASNGLPSIVRFELPDGRIATIEGMWNGHTVIPVTTTLFLG